MAPDVDNDLRCHFSNDETTHLRQWNVLPSPRGPLSDAVLSAFRGNPGTFGATPTAQVVNESSDDDFQLALYLCYELHYSGIADPGWEWDPQLLSFRAQLEKCFERRLRDECVAPSMRGLSGTESVANRLVELISHSNGPSLSSYLSTEGSLDQMREFCIHRSAYQLKEADPHTFAIPRLSGPAKAAMLQVQFDEYGSGDPGQMHSELFARTMSELGLDARYGAYVDVIPGFTLATVNLVSMFALHRRWRGALVGHLAVFEMTSVEPMGRYSNALRRLGVSPAGRRFYDVHVVADAEHAVIAKERLVGGLIDAEPDLAPDLLFGAATVMALEARFSRQLLAQWDERRTSLLGAAAQHVHVTHCNV